MNINFHNQIIHLLPSGALYLEGSNALICSDLHLGKGVLLKDSGVPLIDQLDTKTVANLCHDLATFNPKLCIICGDLIHAKSNHLLQQLQWFEEQLKPFNTSFICTLGNHDSKFLPTYLSTIRCVTHYVIDSIYCSHYQTKKPYSISGHLHPGIKVKKGRITQSYKAFVVSQKHIICPSYGIHTGTFSEFGSYDQLYIIKHNKVERYHQVSLK